MAEGIFRKIAENDTALHNVSVASAGLMADNGACASANAVAVCRERDIDISRHTATILTAERIDNTDLFVCMTYSHAFALMEQYHVPKNKIYVLDVSDPYGGDIAVYRQCCADIDKKLVVLADLIKKHYGNEL